VGQRIAAELRAAILDGRYLPGERIRQEEVADRHRVSRLPVREALRVLESEGLVEQEPHKGARVARLDAEQLDALYRIRERVEPLALTLSIPLLGDSAFDELERIQLAIEANTDLVRFLALDRELHLMTYSGCRVDHLGDLVVRLWNSTQHYRRAFVRLAGPSRMWVVNAEHRLLIDAIRRRDVEDGERFLAGHIRRTRIELAGRSELWAPAPA
jgi:DNA-binding GntR family transcriptional regulator